MNYREMFDSGQTVDDIHKLMKPVCVDKPRKPTLERNPTAEDAEAYVNALGQYEIDLARYKAEKVDYDKLDIEHHNNMVDLLWYIAGDVPEQYRAKVYSKAWADGHSYGWGSISNDLNELAEIFQ